MNYGTGIFIGDKITNYGSGILIGKEIVDFFKGSYKKGTLFGREVHWDYSFIGKARKAIEKMRSVKESVKDHVHGELLQHYAAKKSLWPLFGILTHQDLEAKVAQKILDKL